MTYRNIYYAWLLCLLYLSYRSFTSMVHMSSFGSFRKGSRPVLSYRKIRSSDNFHYNLLRAGGVMLFLLAGCLLFRHHTVYVFLISGILFVVTMPVKKMFGVTSPYVCFSKLYQARKKRNLDKELLELLIMLRNMADSADSNNFSRDFIFDTVMTFASPLTKKYWMNYSLICDNQMLSQAEDYFLSKINTDLAAGFMKVLSTVDRLPLDELKQEIDQVISRQQSKMDAVKEVAQIRISDVYYFLAIVLLALIAVNFTNLFYKAGMMGFNIF